MPAELTGDITALRAARTRLAMLRETRGLLTALGYAAEAARIESETDILAAARFSVPVTCLFECGNVVSCAVIISDAGHPEPSLVLCGECNARTEAAARAETGAGS